MEHKLEIVYKNINTLIPYINNTRTHSKEQIEQVKASIKEFGMCTPVGIHNDTLVYGHARVQSMKELGYKEVPTVDLSHLTEAQKKAYIIADNKIALNAGWDEELLKIEIEALQDMDFNIDLLGFNEEELANLDIGLEDLPELDTDKADEVPEVEENPVIKLGDLIELGHNYQHRLLCGDSTKEEDVARLMDGRKADMIHTDPPYNINAESRSKKGIDKIKNDNMSNDSFDIFLDSAFKMMDLFSKDGSVAYVWHNHKFQSAFEKNLENNHWNIKSQIVWAKDIPSYSTNLYRQKHELCFYCTKDKELDFGKSSDTIWQVPSIQSAKSVDEYGNSWFKGGSKNLNLHVTQKPVRIPEIAIEHQSKAGDEILDLFGGSGSTLIACENLSRQARLMELDEKYAQVIIQRYVDYTSNPKIKINGAEVDWYEYKESKKEE